MSGAFGEEKTTLRPLYNEAHLQQPTSRKSEGGDEKCLGEGFRGKSQM